MTESPELRLRTYIAIIASLAACSLLLPATWTTSGQAWVIALLVLFPISVWLEFVSVPLPSGGTFSMATVPHVATILLVPAPLAAISIGLAVLIEQMVHRTPPLRVVFNVAGTVLPVSLASFLMGPFGSVWEVGSTSLWLAPLPIVVATATFFVGNALLLGGVLAIVQRRSFRSVVRPDPSTVGPELAATALGAQYALTWTVDPPLVVLIAIPAMVIARSFEYIRRLGTETQVAVRSLAKIIDHRDATTFHHSERVAADAVRLATALGLSEPEVMLIEQAAGVHDLGKIGVPDAVLLKPGPLTADEQAVIRRHTDLGAEILAGFGTFRPGAEIVRHHHERWDGAGYPQGLAGTDIPLGARIVAVVDAFDAMTSDRPYRKALDRREGLARLAAGAGIQWDPDIVAAFLRLESADLAAELEAAASVAPTSDGGSPARGPSTTAGPHPPSDLEVLSA